MEKQILVSLIDVAYQGTVATRTLLEGYVGKSRKDFTLADLDNKAILDSYVKDCQKYGFWRLKRQVTDSKAETLAGWKACKAAAKNVLTAQPTNERALELLKAAVVYNRLSTMISAVKAELKTPPTKSEENESGEQEEVFAPVSCPATTVWDMDSPYTVRVCFPLMERSVSVQAQKILAGLTGKETAKQLRAYIEQLAA